MGLGLGLEPATEGVLLDLLLVVLLAVLLLLPVTAEGGGVLALPLATLLDEDPLLLLWLLRPPGWAKEERTDPCTEPEPIILGDNLPLALALGWWQ